MKKRFPSNISQSILLLFLGLAFTTPLLLFEKELLLLFSGEAYILILYSFFGVSAFLAGLLINRRKDISLSFSTNLKVNRDLGIIVLTIISYQLLIAPTILILTKHFSPNHFSIAGHGITYLTGAVLVGPIVEELIFRGMILNGMLDHYQSTRKALFVSALIFGLAHVKIMQAIPAFFWGLVFGYFFYRTKSILLCIALHIVANASGLASIMMFEDHQTVTLASAYGEHSLVVYLISISVFVLCFYHLLGKRQGLQKYIQRYSKAEQAIP